jgi:hypothetical protein
MHCTSRESCISTVLKLFLSAVLAFSTPSCSLFAVAGAPYPVDISGYRPGMPRDYVQAKVGAPETTTVQRDALCDIYNLPTETHGIGYRLVYVVVGGAADVFLLFIPELVTTPLSTADDGMRMVTFCYNGQSNLLRVAEGAPGVVAYDSGNWSSDSPQAQVQPQANPNVDSPTAVSNAAAVPAASVQRPVHNPNTDIHSSFDHF